MQSNSDKLEALLKIATNILATEKDGLSIAEKMINNVASCFSLCSVGRKSDAEKQVEPNMELGEKRSQTDVKVTNLMAEFKLTEDSICNIESFEEKEKHICKEIQKLLIEATEISTKIALLAVAHRFSSERFDALHEYTSDYLRFTKMFSHKLF